MHRYKKKVAILAPFKEGTGNTTSARRALGHLATLGYETFEFSTEQPCGTFKGFKEKNGIDGAVGFHGVHSGQHLIGVSLPYSIVFCNTDLNLDYQEEPQKLLIDRAARGARCLGCYHLEFKERLSAMYPERTDEIFLLPKSIKTHPSQFNLRRYLGLSDVTRVLLFPSGIREVKDPLFLLEPFQRWTFNHSDVHFVIMGSVRDDQYGDRLKAVADGIPQVHIIPGIPIEDCHAAISQSDIVVNSSRFEGVPNALMEAMSLGVPVVARDIPGNASLVTHGDTGLLFSSPEEAFIHIERLLSHEDLRGRLREKAQRFLETNHSSHREREAYGKLAEELFRPRQALEKENNPLIALPEGAR